MNVRIFKPKLILFIGLSFSLGACTNGTPKIRSLGLTTGEVGFVQAQQSTGDLVGNNEGQFDFEIKCAKGMTSLQYSNQQNGPWIDLVPINCPDGTAKVTFVQQTEMADSTYLRTQGSWGNSEPRLVNLFYKMTLKLSGAPANRSNLTEFSISLGGEKIHSYRFSFGATDTQDCSQEKIYGEERPISTPISASDLNYSSLADGNYRLCLIAKSVSGHWSRGDFAESRDWYKDTIAYPASITHINTIELAPNKLSFASNIESPILNIKVDNEEDATVTVYSDNLCTMALASGTTSSAKVFLTIPKEKLNQGNNDFYFQAFDSSSNFSLCERGLSYILDSVKPEILSINGFTIKTYGAGKTISFDVNLSEAVTWEKSTGSPLLELNADGNFKEALFNEALSTPTKLHFDYIVKVGDNDGDGIALINPLVVPEAIQIMDVAKNLLNTNFETTDLKDLKIDTTVPAILSITTHDSEGWVKAGQTISLAVTFSETCKFTSASSIQLPVQFNSEVVNASCPLPASDTNLLNCYYTVLESQVDTDGISINSSSLSIVGTITDLSLNVAPLTMAAKTFPSVKVDAAAPSITGVEITDGTVSSSLTSSPPISWNGSFDLGSGISNYTFQIIDDVGNLVYSQSFANSQTNLIISSLSLSDLTNATNHYRSYSTKLIISDLAGNQSLVTGDGWRVIQFSAAPDITYANSSDSFGSTTAISSDGLRLLVAVKNLRLVKIYAFDSTSEEWIFENNVSDASDGNTYFGSALGILKLNTNSYLYAIGAPGDSDNISGSVFLYLENSGSVNLSQTLKNPNPQADDEFGKSLDFADDLLIIGSPGDDSGISTDSGLIVSYTCSKNIGNCAKTGGGIGYEVDRGSLSNQRLGDLVTVTMQGGTASLYASKSALQLSRYIYSASDMAWLQINCNSNLYCMLWSAGPAMTYLDSFNNTIVASNGTSSAKVSTDGGSFSTLSGTTGTVGPVAVIGDSNYVPASNIGVFILAYDSAELTTRIYKAVNSSSYYYKQTFMGFDFTGGSFSGSGAKILLGSPTSGKVLFLK